MSALSVLVPAGYGLVLLEAIALSAFCVAEGFAGFAVRRRVFSKSFFDKHFPEVKPTPDSGYPGRIHCTRQH